MPVPTTPNLDNVKLGACVVKWGTDDLGYTKGGVAVTINTTTTQITVDQYGDTPINEYIKGRTISVKVPMAESDLQKLVLAIPGAELVVDSTTPTKMNLKVGVSQGTSLRSLAKKLTLHPSGVDAADKSQDLNITLAAPSGQMDFTYDTDNERVYSVTFMGYPDNTTGELFSMGDESATSS